jgi:hypothetical protein
MMIKDDDDDFSQITDDGVMSLANGCCAASLKVCTLYCSGSIHVHICTLYITLVTQCF